MLLNTLIAMLIPTAFLEGMSLAGISPSTSMDAGTSTTGGGVALELEEFFFTFGLLVFFSLDAFMEFLSLYIVNVNLNIAVEKKYL